MYCKMNVFTIAFPAKFQINARFAMNLLEAMDILRAKSGYTVKVKYLIGKSNLSHARSIMVTDWYDNSKTGDLFMFIDTDQTFLPEDILRVIGQKGDLRAGIYANRASQPTSMAEGETFNSAENNPLLFAATGFLCFTYEAVEILHAYMKKTEKLDRVVISDGVPMEDNCIPFFNPIIEDINKNGKTYWLGEDFSFSLRARRAGLKINGAIIHTLGHEMPFIVNYNKPIRQSANWDKSSIVYYCGNSRVRFSPTDKSLGGSEQAVVFLSAELVKQGYRVTVYGNVIPCLHEGVRYLRQEEFNVKDKFNIIILWRRFGLEALGPIEFANAVYVDLHDPTDPVALPKDLVQNKIKKIFVKSAYHRSLYPYLPDSQFEIIANGTQTETILAKPKPLRLANRFCYTSCYERGLVPILKYLWPALRKTIQDAELHIHYGSDLISEKTRTELEPLLKSPGVFEHGRSTYEEVIKERLQCLAQLYITDTPMEIDCLSVREAAIAGCIPVLSSKGVFSERAGIHVEGDPSLQSTQEEAATTIIKLYNLPQPQITKFREALFNSSLKQTWAETADLWTKKLVPPTS